MVAGPLSDVYGRRIPILWGIGIYAMSSLLIAFAPSIEILLLLRLIQGMVGSASIVLSRAIARDLFSGSDLTKFLALLAIFHGAAPIFAPIIGGQLMRFTAWPGIFIALSVFGLVMIIFVFFGLPERLNENHRMKGSFSGTIRTFRALFNDKVFIGYALAQGFVSAAMFAYISGSSFVLQNIFGISPQLYNLFFAINGLGFIVACQIIGRLAGRIHETKLFVSGIGVATLGGMMFLLMILMKAELFAVLPSLFLVVASVGVVNTSGFSLALQNHGKSAGSASALLGLISFMLGGMAAPLVGLGGSESAIPMGMMIAAADVGAFLCYLFLVRRRQAATG
jgi:DHA1 family bicyclomycin/chloramphenicol resistance-like MFS transporter